MKTLTKSLLMAGFMLLASVAGIAARPSQKSSAIDPGFSLEQTVPKEFGDWTVMRDLSAQVVNPQTQQLLDKLYSQVLTRTYVNSNGYRVMLSLAYGDDQRGGLAAHRPEVCYPAQGFAVLNIGPSAVQTPFGTIQAKRLSTKLGHRAEPVTYWFNVGNSPVSNQVEQRIAEIRLGLSGQIPDGLLFRVSSIDDSAARGYQMQDEFVAALLKAVGAKERLRLAGLQPPRSGG